MVEISDEVSQEHVPTNEQEDREQQGVGGTRDQRLQNAQPGIGLRGKRRLSPQQSPLQLKRNPSTLHRNSLVNDALITPEEHFTQIHSSMKEIEILPASSKLRL